MRPPARCGVVGNAHPSRVRFSVTIPDDRALGDGHGNPNAAPKRLGDDRPDRDRQRGIIAGRGLPAHHRWKRQQPSPAGRGPRRASARLRSPGV